MTATALTPLAPTPAVRHRLPNRRGHDVITFEFCGAKYISTVSRFAAGGIAEVFLNCTKTGSELDRIARDSATLLSIALQHGVPIESFRKALSRTGTGAPDSPLAFLLDQLAGEGDQ